jgi:hypothetical protein
MKIQCCGSALVSNADPDPAFSVSADLYPVPDPDPEI